MKKSIFLFALLFLVFCFSFVSESYGYSKTGHEDFKKIEFALSHSKLLNEYSEESINRAYDNIGKQAFGWKTYYFQVNRRAYYEGITIFARVNKTSKPIDFEYSLKETETTQVSVTVSGSVSAKIAGTIKKISTTITGNFEGAAEKEDTNTYTSDAKTSISISILPNTQVSMIITGEAYVTNGVSKFRIFGITFRKGAWERIDVDTIYYELREEKI